MKKAFLSRTEKGFVFTFYDHSNSHYLQDRRLGLEASSVLRNLTKHYTRRGYSVAHSSDVTRFLNSPMEAIFDAL